MIQIPDHPVIRACERTGYPNYTYFDEDDQIDEEDDEDGLCKTDPEADSER